MAFNIDNFCISTGRLVSDPKFFVNRDGSRKVRFTVAIQNNFKNANGERDAQFLPLEAFIPANVTASVYDLIHKGDKVTAEYAIYNNNYVDTDGIQHYDLILRVDSLKMQESKAVTQARREDGAA